MSTVTVARPDALEQYAAMGVERGVLLPPFGSLAEGLAQLEAWSVLVDP